MKMREVLGGGCAEMRIGKLGARGGSLKGGIGDVDRDAEAVG